MVIMEFRAQAVLRKLVVVIAGVTFLTMAWIGEFRTPSTADDGARAASGVPSGTAKPVAANTMAVTQAGTAEKKVALTFELDRGEVQYGEILRALENEGLRATFFLAGTWAALHPDELKLIARKGHEIGLLGYRQIDLTGLPPAEIRSELRYGQVVLESGIGHQARLFRPPLGRGDESLFGTASALGLTPVMWTADSHDSEKVSPGYITRRLLSHARPGAIFRLHSGDTAVQTASALPDLIRGLRSRGFEIVTAGQLIDGSPGSIRSLP